MILIDMQKKYIYIYTLRIFRELEEKEMATHSSILAWRIPGREEPGGLPPMGSHRVGHNRSDLAAAGVGKNLPANAGDVRDVSIPGSGRSPGEGPGNPRLYSCLENHHGQGSPVGYSPWGCTESDTTEAT